MDISSIKNILKFISLVGIVLGIFFLLPLIVGLIYTEDIENYLFFDLGFIILNIMIYILLIKHKMNMSIKESILSVNIIWILLGVVGGTALYITSNISIADGFFEAISGFTTTGATIYNDIEGLSHLTLMLRSLMHWLGGMGIIVLGVGLLSLINPAGSMTLFKSESTGIKMEKSTPKIKDTAKSLWLIYFTLTILDMLLLKLEGMNWFDAINHAFSTISTGGFSTKNNSMAFWQNNSAIIWTTTIFMFLSGINFLAHLRLLNKDFLGYKSEEVKWYLVIFLILSITLTLTHILIKDDNFYHSLTHSFFTISSIITTTGFVSLDYSKWSAISISIIFIAMFIGANAGSTAGGVKVIRYIVLFKNLFSQIKQMLHPNAVIGMYIDKQRVTNKILGSVLGFFFLYAITNIFLTLYLFGSGYDFLTSFSASLACIGNIGPGFSHVGPVDNFVFFTSTQKIVLSIFMIIGRLEFYTFIILFSRDFWKKF